MSEPSFQERVDQWKAEAPERAAKRASKSPVGKVADKAIGLGAIGLVAVIALAVLGLAALLLLSIAAEWRLLFAIAVVVLFGLAAAEIRKS